MSPPVPPWFHKQLKLNRILKQQTKEKEERSAENTVEQQQEQTLDIRMRRKSKEIMKEGKCLASDKKTKEKKRSRHWETLEQDDGSTILIDVMKKNEDLSDQWLHSVAKRLKVLTSNVDVFAADVLYHQSFYDGFVYS